MSKKRVRLSCHGHIAVGRQYESPWADIYLSYRTRPGRVQRFGPCLISKTALETDIENERRANLRSRGEYLKELEVIHALLESTPIFVNRVDGLYKKGIPNIYTAAPWITREVAEQMLEHFLKELGVVNVKFSWDKPSMIITTI